MYIFANTTRLQLNANNVCLNSNKIKELRIKKGVTQFIMAVDTDISTTIISRIETNEHYNPGFCTILKIAQYLGVAVEDITDVKLEE